MRVRIVNTGAESVTVPIVPAQAQLEDLLEAAGWLSDERLHTGMSFKQVLIPGEQGTYPAKRFTHDQLVKLEAMREAGIVAVFVE
jgi:hypothetical protein